MPNDSQYLMALKEVDAFSQNFSVPAGAGATNQQFRLVTGDALSGSLTGRSGQDLVRRPLRGLQIKEDTFATLAIIDNTQKFWSTRNSSSWDETPKEGPAGDGAKTPNVGWGDFNSNFILTGVNEERSEKFQAMSTFGPTYGFFFGENPRFVTYSAVLLNTADFQWEVEWWYNYENYLRGTKLVERRSRVYLTYDDVIVEGYIMNAATSKQAQNTGEVPLRFTMWVTHVEPLVTPGSMLPAWDVEGGVTSFDTSTFESSTAAVRAASIAAYGKKSTGLLATLRNAVSTVENLPIVLAAEQAFSDVKNFLYGRNIVVPSGFIGSERQAGFANFASGSGAEAVAALLAAQGTPITIRVPATVVPNKKTKKTFYDGNWDEYPQRADAATPTADQLALLGQPGSASYDAESAALNAFAQVGITLTAGDNITGKGPSEDLQLLGRAVNGVITLSAAFGGLNLESQNAADEQQRRDELAQAAAESV